MKLDSPCNIGSCILDLSKILIYNTFYTLRHKDKDNIRMMYNDKDGFICNVRNIDDVYKAIFENNMLDMSLYDETFKYYRKSIYEMGKSKDNSAISVITEAA